jgi:N-acetyl-anhydromuramyl-L-alanine amidase AmpD
MVAVYCGLEVVDKGPVAAAEGLSLTPLMNTSGVETVEAVFNTKKPIDHARWQAIVIHDSGSPLGTYASLDAQARANGLKGVGNHFVIGNGKGIDDGQVIIGRRWSEQAPGAHAAGSKGDWFNSHSIGICLIGDGNRSRPTPAQMRSLVKLADALAREFKIPADRVYLHSQIAPTDDPGRLFPEATLRAQLPKL